MPHHLTIDLRGVRRIKERNLELPGLQVEAPERGRNITVESCCFACDPKRCEIGLDYRARVARTLDKGRFSGAATQGLDADRSGARANVQKSTAADSRCEDIEQRFAQAVGCRSDCEPTDSAQSSATMNSADNSHCWRMIIENYDGPWPAVRSPWSVVRGQWSVASGQWSVVSGPWSVVSGQWYVSEL